MKKHLELWEQMDLPGEAFPGQTLVEISGESRVLIEHHRGVREYSTQRIGVKAAFGLVEVTGCGLELRCMTKEQLVICGRIHGVELKRGNG